MSFWTEDDADYNQTELLIRPCPKNLFKFPVQPKTNSLIPIENSRQQPPQPIPASKLTATSKVPNAQAQHKIWIELVKRKIAKLVELNSSDM